MSEENNEKSEEVRENKTLEIFDEHMEMVLETVISLRNLMERFSKCSDFSEETESIMNNEQKADEIKEKIMDELSKSEFPIARRDEISNFLETSEDIADRAKAVAKRIHLLNPEDVEGDMRSDLHRLSETSLEAVKILKESLSILLSDEEIEKLIERTDKVENLEEEADQLRWEILTPKFIKWGDDLHKPGTVRLFMEVEENIEEVADQAENCADTIRRIGISKM